MKVGRQSQGQGLELVSIVGSESDVWHSGLRAARPIRPSLPWCLQFRKLQASWKLAGKVKAWS